MKDILVSLFAAYTVTSGQTPNVNPATPTRYINPFCPSDTVLQHIGTPPPTQTAGSSVKACWSSPQYGSSLYVADTAGVLECGSYACCSCEYLHCGGSGTPCSKISISDYGAIGAPFINVDGPSQFQSLLPNQPQPVGAEILCGGLESCKAANILGRNVATLSCNGASGCQQSNIILLDPYPSLNIYCNGMYSCLAAKIEINIGEAPPPGQMCNVNYIPRIIELGEMIFSGQQSAQNAVITVNNLGCDKVYIKNIECPTSDSCGGTQFIFNGDIELQASNVAPPPPPQQTQPPQQIPVQPQQTAPPQQQILGMLRCADYISCQNAVRVIDNPGPGFELECVLSGSCDGLQLTINYAMDPLNPGNYVSNIKGFTFDAPNAAVGAVITINNNQNGFVVGSYGKTMKLDQIKCRAAGACNGVTIKSGPNVNILDVAVDCAEPMACIGCTIEQDGVIPYPCDYNSQSPVTQPQQGVQPGFVALPYIPSVVNPIPAPQTPVNPGYSPYIPAPNPV